MKIMNKFIKPAPRGQILVLSGVLLFAFFGLVALAVDTGVIAMARARLQTVADAAALAGARQLVRDRRLSSTITDLTPEMEAATSQAITIGQHNYVLDQKAVITPSDVVIGYLDPNNPSDTLHTGASDALRYNSVQVTASRSSDRVGVVPAFFSSLLGYGGSNISVTSTATINLYQIKSYKIYNNLNANLSPIVMSLTNYNEMMNGTPGPDGVHESVSYPVQDVTGSNWGTLNFIGNGGNGTSTLFSEIDNGVPPGELSNLPTWYYAANTDIISSTELNSHLNSLKGYPVAVPIYDFDNGENGTNLQYHVFAYAIIRFVEVDLPTPPGNLVYVRVQPAVGDDPTAFPDTTANGLNLWTQGGQIVLHLSR